MKVLGPQRLDGEVGRQRGVDAAGEAQNGAVDASGLEEATLKYAEKVASKSPHVLKIGKRAFYEQLDETLDEAYRHTAEVMTENMLARDAAEGIDAFLEKREPQWKGE